MNLKGLNLNSIGKEELVEIHYFKKVVQVVVYWIEKSDRR